MSDFQLHRRGVLMEPQPGNPNEVEGVLNPAAVRGPDGHLYLFPRLVAKGNYSRIGIAQVRFDDTGDPIGVDRLGVALEPEADYEIRPDGGGCEDPRVTYMERLQCYVMSYTALSPSGPRIALAVSDDLLSWTRLGLVQFESFCGIDFGNVDDKDASLFPVAIPNHAGKMQMAILHRPLFPGTRPEETACQNTEHRWVDVNHESIWISYCPVSTDGFKVEPPGLFNSHHRLAAPVAAWEQLKIGGGTPPVMTRHGWMVVYHGVSDIAATTSEAHHLCYSAGVMILSKKHPQEILYRSPDPVLTPDAPQERIGTVANVVFPTGIDRRDDLGLPNRFDVYYGMADNRIGVASMMVPEHLPESPAQATPPNHASLRALETQAQQ